MRRTIALVLILGATMLVGCGSGGAPAGALATASPTAAGASGAPSVSSYAVVNSWPHDPTAFTEGLIFDHGAFYESIGLNGASSLRKVDPQTGHVLMEIPVPAEYFAEGLTLFDGTLFQLTWQSHKGFVYGLDCFCLRGEFAYDGEGWGLTHDGRLLIMSDGTPRIRFLDPHTFAVVRTIEVADSGAPVLNLNELEYIGGEIWANIWQTDRIARIDPGTGRVVGWIDLAGLRPTGWTPGPEEVLNGIAYDAATKRIFVTGKDWPQLFEIRLSPRSGSTTRSAGSRTRA